MFVKNFEITEKQGNISAENFFILKLESRWKLLLKLESLSLSNMDRVKVLHLPKSLPDYSVH